MGEPLKLRIIIRWQETHSAQLRFADHQAQYVIRNRMERLSKEDNEPDPSEELLSWECSAGLTDFLRVEPVPATEECSNPTDNSRP